MDALGVTVFVLEMGYGVLATLVAILVLSLGAGRPANRTLGWLLLAEGIGMGGIFAALRNPHIFGGEITRAAIFPTGISFIIVPGLYILFVRTALRGPVARALRARWVMPAVILVTGLLLAAGFAGLRNWLGLVAAMALSMMLIGSGIIGLVAAVQNHRLSRGALEARKSRAYLRAFIARDVGFAVGYVAATFIRYGLGANNYDPIGMALTSFLQLCWIAFILFLAYGVLSGQVLDLNQKFRVGISGTAAAALVAGLFVVLTEVVESLFSWNNSAVSIMVAVAMAAAFRPVQTRVEQGVARFLPHEVVTAEHYDHAVQRALADGKVTVREQRVLDGLQARMKLEDD